MILNPRLITKINVVETLKNIEPGETVLFKQRDIDGCTLRATASRLAKDGFQFTCTANIEGTVVKRLK